VLRGFIALVGFTMALPDVKSPDTVRTVATPFSTAGEQMRDARAGVRGPWPSPAGVSPR
jgi:hypothetical protein